MQLLTASTLTTILILVCSNAYPASASERIALTQTKPVVNLSVDKREFGGVGYVDYSELQERKVEAGFGHITDSEYNRILIRCITQEAAQSARLIFISDECLAGGIELNETIITRLKELKSGHLNQAPKWSGVAKIRMEKVLSSWPAALREGQREKEKYADLQQMVNLCNQRLLQSMQQKQSARNLEYLKKLLQEKIDEQANNNRQDMNKTESRLLMTMSDSAGRYARQYGINYVLVDEYSATAVEDISEPLQVMLHGMPAGEAPAWTGTNPYRLAVVDTATIYQTMSDLEIPESQQLARLRKICHCILLKGRYNAVLSIYAVIAGAEDVTDDALKLLKE